MIVVRRGTQDGVNGLLFFEHDSEILKISHLVVRCFFGKMLFDFGFNGQPAGLALEIERVEVLNLHWVSHCDYLDIRMLEQVADIRLALPAAANNCQVDLFAGRNEFRSSQHMTWHERDTRHRGGRAGEELAASQRLLINLWFHRAILLPDNSWLCPK